MSQLSLPLFEILGVRGWAFLLGDPPLRKENMAGLSPGERVAEIGQYSRGGKGNDESSSSRLDRWDPWVEYAGVATLELPSLKPTDYALFKLPPGGLLRDGAPLEPVFVPYAICDLSGDLIRQNFRSLSIRIHRPVFKKV